MKSEKEIRSVLANLKATAFKDHGMELSPEATMEYLQHMAHQRVIELFSSQFAKFSIADLLTAADFLETEAALAPTKVKRHGDRGMN